MRLVARVRSDLNPESAAQELNAIARTRMAEYPRPQWAALQDGFIANPLQDELTRSVRPALIAVAGAVILLLTIACVNVTNLLLAQGAARHGELSVRTALGASRSRIIRQLLAETLLLAVMGGGLGIVLAHSTLDALLALTPPELPRAAAITIDRPVLAFAAGLTAAASTIGPVIPPSIPFVVYGVLAEVNIGDLFLAGFIPGVLMGIALMIYVRMEARKGNYPRRERASLGQVMRTAGEAAPALLLPLIIVGGIVGGVFTPTEAAGRPRCTRSSSDCSCTGS